MALIQGEYQRGEPPASEDIARAGETMETVAIVIPTLSEERSIGKVIDGVPVADLLKNGLTVISDDL